MNRTRLITVAFLLAAPAFAQTPTTITPNSRGEEWWQKRHDSFVAHSKSGGVQVVFLGDSITQGWEGEGKEVWQKAFAPLKAGNYGIGGDQTQHLLWRITEGKELSGINPKVAVLMIGTNNIHQQSAEDIALGVETIVKDLRKQKRGIKVLVLGIFPRGRKEDAKRNKIAAKDLNPKVAEVNRLIKKVDDGAHVFFLNINKVFLNSDGSLSGDIMPDYLHLSRAGYELWAKAVEGKVKTLLK